MRSVSLYPLLYILIVPLLSLVYTAINYEPQHIRMLYTDLDHAIPFVKSFIIPYMIWMPFLYGTLIYFYFKDRKLYFNTLIAYTIGVLICYGIYLVFQTYVPRPDIVSTDVLSKFVSFIYRNDQPYNCFPSIHCFSSYLLYYAASKSSFISGKVKTGIGALVILILLSTVFVKQHVVLDVFAGVVLAHVVFAGVYKYFYKTAVFKQHALKVKHDKRGLLIAKSDMLKARARVKQS